MNSPLFRARGIREPAVCTLNRELARAACRVFRAADGFEVAIPASIIERGLTFCRRVRPLEWYGVLVGTLHQDERGTHVLVRGMVLDPEAQATASSVRSTTNSEAELRRRAALFYPDAVVLGWAHGHPPGAGAFFSATDRANQKTWTEKNALGLVFEAEDPKELAVFRGAESELLQLAASDAPGTTANAATLDAFRESLLLGKLIDEVVERRTAGREVELRVEAAVGTWLLIIAIAAVGIVAYDHWDAHIAGRPEPGRSAESDAVLTAAARNAAPDSAGSPSRELPTAPAAAAAPIEAAQCVPNSDAVTALEATASMDEAAPSRMEESHAHHHAAGNRPAGRRSGRRAP